MKKGISKGIFALLACGMFFGLTGCKPHEHEYASEITKQATCTEKGTKTFTCECGDSYTEEISALGHNAGAQWTKDAEKHWKTCTRCSAKLEEADHAWNAGAVKTQPGCTTQGITEYTCTVCGQTKEEPIAAKHDLEFVAGTPATEFATGTLGYYACKSCTAKFLDEAGTIPFTSQDQLIDPIKSITVTEAFTKAVGEEVVVRGVIIGAYFNNDYKELLIKDLENDKIIAVSGYDEVFETTDTNLLGNLKVGQVVACYGKMKCDTVKADGVTAVCGGQLSKIRIAGDNVVLSGQTASTKITRPDNIPVVKTTQELDEVLKAEHSQYQYIKLQGPIYGYFASSNGVISSVRFWLGENNNKDALCNQAGGGSCLTAYGYNGTNRTRPLISVPAVATNFGGKTIAECLGITDMTAYSSYTKYFTFEGEMYVMCVGGNVWSAHFLPLVPEDIVPHTTCVGSTTTHSAVAATELAHGNIEYFECQFCGKLYKDAACTTRITLEETIVHKYNHITGVAATATQDGIKEHYVCPICNQKFYLIDGEYVKTDDDMRIIAVGQDCKTLGHDYGTNQVVKIVRDQNGNSRTLKLCDRCNHYINQTTLEEFETTITYSFNRATVGYTFKNGDKILIGNGQGGKGPGARLAFQATNDETQTDKWGTRAYDNNNDAYVCKYYDDDCIFTLVEGTDENAGTFAIQNCVGGYVDRSNNSVSLGWGYTKIYSYWEFTTVEPSKPDYVANTIIKDHVHESRYITAQYTSSNGYRIGRKDAESVNTVAVFVYTATLTPIAA